MDCFLEEKFVYMKLLIVVNKLVEKALKWKLMRANLANVNITEDIKLMDNGCLVAGENITNLKYLWSL